MMRLTEHWNRSSIGVVLVFSAQVSGAALSFAFSVLLARLIGASGVGLYFIATTIVDVGATVSRLGLENPALRFAAVAHNRGERASLAALHWKILGLVAAMALAVAVPAWSIVPRLPLGGARAGELRAALPWVVLAFVPVAVRAIQAEFYKGIGAPGTGTFLHSVLPPVVLLLGGVALWCRGAATFQDVVLTYVIVAFFAAFCALLAWNRSLPNLWRERGHFDTSLLLRTGLPLLLASFGYLAMNWTDILVLGSYSDPSEVGIYGVARRITILMTTFVMASVNSVTAPQFAALYSQGNTMELSRLTRQCTGWMLLITTPLILTLLVFPEVALKPFGTHFEQGAWPLRVLALGQLVMVGVGPVECLLMMTGHEKVLRNIVGASAIANVVGNLVLVPSYGAMGAATSTAFCITSMAIACMLMIRKKLKITTWSVPCTPAHSSIER
jgi:O-antigen/teichoic acid export membrane protein